jgi:hypothetical protein
LSSDFRLGGRRAKYIEKRKRNLILITKKERFELEKQGFKMGEHIFHTVSNKRKYYASESPRIKEAIQILRKNEV